MLKKIILLGLFAFLTTISCTSEDDSIRTTNQTNTDGKTKQGNYDLEISIANMTKGQVFETGNIVFEWNIKNVGTTTITKGEKIYLSLLIDNTTQFDLSLTNTGEDAATEIELTEDLTPDNFITHKEGGSILNVEATLGYLDKESAELCFPLWGVNKASIGTYKGDTTTNNNRFCIVFDTP